MLMNIDFDFIKILKKIKNKNKITIFLESRKLVVITIEGARLLILSVTVNTTSYIFLVFYL